VKVTDIKKRLLLSIDPLLFGDSLALRAVSVATGVVGDFAFSTVAADIYMSA
jgi:hypothetical protein